MSAKPETYLDEAEKIKSRIRDFNTKQNTSAQNLAEALRLALRELENKHGIAVDEIRIERKTNKPGDIKAVAVEPTKFRFQAAIEADEIDDYLD
jgi:hypothetical protein